MVSGQDAGLVFNIQRFSLHDGPGIRDLVFFKGCPLRCKFCDNPESQNGYPELAFNEDRCIGCGECQKVCPVGAITLSADEKASIDRSLCTNCGLCAEVCPAKAVRLYGEYLSVEEVLDIVQEDSPFYWRSNGGVTVSGGEPTFQAAFVHELLKEAKKRFIHTAIQTCGHSSWDCLEEICIYANLVFYDLKHMDPDKHQAFTGVTNKLILANIKKLSRRFPDTPVIVRTPVVPGFNDSDENIEATIKFLSGISNVQEYRLLPYHKFGEPKYGQLDREYPLKGLKGIVQEKMDQLERIVQENQ